MSRNINSAVFGVNSVIVHFMLFNLRISGEKGFAHWFYYLCFFEWQLQEILKCDV